MKIGRLFSLVILMAAGSVLFSSASVPAESLKERNAHLLEELKQIHGLSYRQMEAVRDIFNQSGYIGQGNPAITEHPMTPQACQEKLDRLKVRL